MPAVPQETDTAVTVADDSGVTVSVALGLVTPPSDAVMADMPVPTPVANPVALMVATRRRRRPRHLARQILRRVVAEGAGRRELLRRPFDDARVGRRHRDRLQASPPSPSAPFEPVTPFSVALIVAGTQSRPPFASHPAT